jgi:hypothetical protein
MSAFSPANMSQRTKRNRTRLLSRMALLALCYALPLGGLALFFLMTGLRSRIVLAERERYGVRYIRQLVEVHDHAVQELSGWRSDRPGMDAARWHRGEAPFCDAPALALGRVHGDWVVI